LRTSSARARCCASAPATTRPTSSSTAVDADLRRDVELVRALGFDCARKHQKLEDPRWLYWADRLGLMVWDEMPSGRDFTSVLLTDLVREWTRMRRHRLPSRRERGSRRLRLR
ncbi:MAG: hypothetical protein ABFS46_20815, partial [Myxococcota bacterium]